jgi:predicted hydrolase (HD superfamily)
MNTTKAQQLIQNFNNINSEDDLVAINLADYDTLVEVYREYNENKEEYMVWILLHNLFDFEELGLAGWQKIKPEYEGLWEIFKDLEDYGEIKYYVSDEVLEEIFAEFKKIKSM